MDVRLKELPSTHILETVFPLRDKHGNWGVTGGFLLEADLLSYVVTLRRELISVILSVTR